MCVIRDIALIGEAPFRWSVVGCGDSELRYGAVSHLLSCGKGSR
jgi:hypothetical protein